MSQVASTRTKMSGSDGLYDIAEIAAFLEAMKQHVTREGEVVLRK